MSSETREEIEARKLTRGMFESGCAESADMCYENQSKGLLTSILGGTVALSSGLIFTYLPARQYL